MQPTSVPQLNLGSRLLNPWLWTFNGLTQLSLWISILIQWEYKRGWMRISGGSCVISFYRYYSLFVLLFFFSATCQFLLFLIVGFHSLISISIVAFHSLFSISIGGIQYVLPKFIFHIEQNFLSLLCESSSCGLHPQCLQNCLHQIVSEPGNGTIMIRRRQNTFHMRSLRR